MLAPTDKSKMSTNHCMNVPYEFMHLVNIELILFLVSSRLSVIAKFDKHVVVNF